MPECGGNCAASGCHERKPRVPARQVTGETVRRARIWKIVGRTGASTRIARHQSPARGPSASTGFPATVSPRPASPSSCRRRTTPVACATSRSRRGSASTWITTTRAARTSVDRAVSASAGFSAMSATLRSVTLSADTLFRACTWIILPPSSSREAATPPDCLAGVN